MRITITEIKKPLRTLRSTSSCLSGLQSNLRSNAINNMLLQRRNVHGIHLLAAMSDMSCTFPTVFVQEQIFRLPERASTPIEIVKKDIWEIFLLFETLSFGILKFLGWMILKKYFY